MIDKDFFEKIIGFDSFIKIFVENGNTGAWFKPMFAKNFDELSKIFVFYNNKFKNRLHVGVNPMKEFNAKDEGVSCIKNIVFDIDGVKKKLVKHDDVEYNNNLVVARNIIATHLSEKYGLNLNAIVKSGRGLHLYFSFKKGDCIPTSFKKIFKLWYKKVCSELDELMPIKGEIIFDLQHAQLCNNLGMPGSVELKYPEKPVREILFTNYDNLNEFSSNDKLFFGISENKMAPKIGGKVIVGKKYDEKSIFSCKEFKLLSEHDDLPEGELNNKIIFALSLIVRDNKLGNVQEIEEALAELGYEHKRLGFVSDEFSYSTSIFNKWCLDNYAYCFKNGITIYPFKKDFRVKSQNFNLNIDEKPDEVLDSFDKVLVYVKNFNLKHSRLENDVLMHPTDALLNNLEKYVKKELFDYIMFCDLFKNIKFFKGA